MGDGCTRWKLRADFPLKTSVSAQTLHNLTELIFHGSTVQVGKMGF